MKIEQHKSLCNLNTLGFDQKAEYFCEPENVDELCEALEFARKKSLSVFALGAGSNIVLAGDIAGLTIKYSGNSVRYTKLDSHTLVTADAGVNWHELVVQTVDKGLYGLENLSLIPGTIGAAPIQNIGAYGVELSDVLTEIAGLDIISGNTVTLSKKECELGYRDSIFKRDLNTRIVITSVTLDLSTTRKVNTTYKALADELTIRAIENPTARDISEAVCAIRIKKLPDPSTIGNAGSFFKNPVVDYTMYRKLKSAWPDMPVHSNDDIGSGKYKIPAAWLIESAGWKGYRKNNVGVHHLQALVLLHFGGAAGSELLNLSQKVQRSIADTFNIQLEQEPTTVGIVEI